MAWYTSGVTRVAITTLWRARSEGLADIARSEMSVICTAPTGDSSPAVTAAPNEAVDCFSRRWRPPRHLKSFRPPVAALWVPRIGQDELCARTQSRDAIFNPRFLASYDVAGNVWQALLQARA